MIGKLTAAVKPNWRPGEVSQFVGDSSAGRKRMWSM